MKVHLYWWRSQNLNFLNFGDEIGKYLIENLFQIKVVRVLHPSMRRYKYLLIHYLTAGSIISEAKENSIVWGSGIMFKNQFVRNANFLAVRGPYTQTRIKELGYKAPVVLGDPGLLLPKCYRPRSFNKKYKIGIVPHYVDYIAVLKLYRNCESIRIINLQGENLESIIDDIYNCDYILSSSLHGLIVAHAYCIPAIWIKISGNLGGDDIKFYDYLETVGLKDKTFIDFTRKIYDESQIIDLVNKNGCFWKANQLNIAKIQSDLLEVAPWSKSRFNIFLFKINHRIKFILKMVKSFKISS